MDRLGLLGVSAEQIREKQRNERLQRQQSLFSQARSPEQLSGMAIASLIGSLGRGLFGKASQAEQDAQLRKELFSETDFQDVNSILGTADVLRSSDPRTAAQYDVYAQNMLTQQAQDAQAAEDRELAIRTQSLGNLKTAEQIKDIRLARDKVEKVDTTGLFDESYYRSFLLSNRGAIKDVAALIDPKGWDEGQRKLSDEQAEALIDVMSRRAAAIYKVNPELSDVEILGRVVQSITGVGDYVPEQGGLDAQLKPEEPKLRPNETTEITPVTATSGAKKQARLKQIADTNKEIDKLNRKIRFYSQRGADDPRVIQLRQELADRKKFLTALTGE